MTKTCTTCGQTKSLDCFHVQARGSLGRASWCKDCACAHRRRMGAIERAQFGDALRAKKRAWYHSNKDSARNTRLKSSYGISLEEYTQLLKAQGGLCAICRRPERVKKYGNVANMAVDHAHDGTGAIRGLLCDKCNRGIGLLGDENLAAAAGYISEHLRRQEEREPLQRSA